MRKPFPKFCLCTLILVLSCTLVACTGTDLSSPAQAASATQANDHPSPPVYAAAAYLMDADTGATLYSKNASTHLATYSTTKLMTALIAVEHGNLDQTVLIDDKIQYDFTNWLTPDSSLMGIKGGERYTMQDLLDGLLLPSGNDAAVAIADAVAGSVPAFVTLMNQKAQELGMADTHYTNPHGLYYASHYSSAKDLAILGRASLKNPIIRQISSTKEIHLPATNGHPSYDLLNGNQFMWWYPGVDGGKPGYDGDKNFNQVIFCSRNGRHLIGVVLGTVDWWTDMRDLLNWGFDTYQWASPADAIKQHSIPYAADWNNFTGDKKENTIPSSDGGRYYIYTGYSITSPILPYFDNNGGLQKFGFPMSQAQSSSGKTKQRFEHATIICGETDTTCSHMTG